MPYTDLLWYGNEQIRQWGLLEEAAWRPWFLPALLASLMADPAWLQWLPDGITSTARAPSDLRTGTPLGPALS